MEKKKPFHLTNWSAERCWQNNKNNIDDTGVELQTELFTRQALHHPKNESKIFIKWLSRARTVELWYLVEILPCNEPRREIKIMRIVFARWCVHGSSFNTSPRNASIASDYLYEFFSAKGNFFSYSPTNTSHVASICTPRYFGWIFYAIWKKLPKESERERARIFILFSFLRFSWWKKNFYERKEEGKVGLTSLCLFRDIQRIS